MIDLRDAPLAPHQATGNGPFSSFTEPDHDQESVDGLRLVLLILLVAATQVAVVDASMVNVGVWRFGSVAMGSLFDLPVAFVAVLVARRPSVAPWCAFALGLLVDAYQLRLFGFNAGLLCAGAAGCPWLLRRFANRHALVVSAGLTAMVIVTARLAVLEMLGVGQIDSGGDVATPLVVLSVTSALLAVPFAAILDRRQRRLLAGRWTRRGRRTRRREAIQRGSGRQLLQRTATGGFWLSRRLRRTMR